MSLASHSAEPASRDDGIVSPVGVADRAAVGSVVGTFFTTASIFGIFLVQGILLARILGPVGRGEFGSSIYFPRDLLLYAGLLGGIEIVNRLATRQTVETDALKFAAARLGLTTGLLTATIAALTSTMFLVVVGKQYLIPFALLCSLFVPWEHIQLNVGAVDRGQGRFFKYNRDRLIFAASFPVGLAFVWGSGLNHLLALSDLTLVCLLFVLARVVGLLPTLSSLSWRQWWSDRWIADRHRRLLASSALMRRGRPYACSTLATELFERMDIFLIMALATVEQSGYYFVAVPAAGLLIIAPNVMGVFTFNAGADPYHRVTWKRAVAFTAGLAGLQTLATLIMAGLLPILIVLFYGSEYRPAIPFALWLLPASAMRGFLQAVDGYLKGRGRPWVGVWTRMISLAVMLVFVLVVWRWHGLLTIPMAACVGQAVSLVLLTAATLLDVWQVSDHDPTTGGETC